MAYNSQFDQAGMSPEALAAFAALESAAGRGFGVNSAYRSEEHNAKVGGAKHSQHTKGNAFDIDVADLSEAERVALIQQARAAGFGGVGVYNNALHFDVGATRAWGADYRSGSIPDWARGAIGSARADGQPMPQQQPPNQFAQMQQEQRQPWQPTYNGLDVRDFQTQPNRLASVGFDQATNPFLAYTRGA